MITMNVVEIFRSIQGEGEKAGLPCAFIRLHGCANRCAFCDTKNSWSGTSYDTLTVDAIVSEVKNSQHVVITGGEPFLQATELMVLVKKLTNTKHQVMIETSGTEKNEDALDALREFAKIPDKVHINLSPKNDKTHSLYVETAHEIKILVGATLSEDPTTSELLENVFKQNCYKSENSFYLVPMFFQPIVYPNNKEKTEAAIHKAIQKAKEYGCRVSFQIHKYAGLR